MKYLTDIEAKTKKGNIKYLDKLREIARQNRKEPTQAEFIMWQYLRKNKFGYNSLDKNQLIDLSLIFIVLNYYWQLR